MAVATTITAGKRRRGGGVPAASFVVAALVAAATFACTEFAHPSGDRIMRHVPKEVVSYLHGNASALGLIGDPRIAGLSPDEFAVAMLETSEGLLPVTIVSWRRLPFMDVPDDARNALAEIDAWQIDDTTFAIGRKAALEALRPPLGSDESLADDRGRADLLDALRGAFNVQMLALRAAGGPAVFGMAPSEIAVGLNANDGRVLGVVADPEAVPRNAFGFRDIQSEGASTRPLVIDGAELAIVPGPDDVSTVRMALASMETARTKAGVPASPDLDAAAAALAKELIGATISIRAEGDAAPHAVTVIPRPESFDAVKNAVSNYASASIPDRRPLMLPDGTWTTELFRAKDEPLEQVGERTFRLAARFRNYGATDLFVMRGEDRVVIASDIAGVNAGMHANPLETSVCASVSVHAPLLILSDSRRFGGIAPHFDAVMSSTGITGVILTEKAPGYVKICGY